MRLDEHIDAIESAIADPRQGLPDEVFGLVTRLTPMNNVDLLIRNDRRETLLTWRDDELYRGWHVPGGIIRFKERMADRVAEVARLELGAAVTIKGAPVAVNEVIHAERHVARPLHRVPVRMRAGQRPPDETLRHAAARRDTASGRGTPRVRPT